MKRWNGPGGYAHLLRIGMPLVMSMISHSVMQFTDRIFLGAYSLDAIAASFPAAITSFLFIALFMGVVEYVSVFVAQYTGAAQHERVGAALWQGLWFCVPAALFLASLALVAEPLFALGGHAAHLQLLEVSYFRILTLGGGFAVTATTLSCFYSGRGMTLPVMFVNVLGALVNIPLDYALINGWGWFPEMGIVGAGLATITGSAVMVLLFALMVFTPENNRCFGVWKNRRLDPALFRRFLRFGLPGGVNFFIDMFAITFFAFIIGRIGPQELAASNMVVSLDLLAFLPVAGMGMAAGVVVGQGIGAGSPELGKRATYSAMHLTLGYMSAMAALFLLCPEMLMSLFRERNMTPAEFAGVVDVGRIMLRYVALYSLLDGALVIYFGALKGAGDIRFVMWSLVVCSMLCMVVPMVLLLQYTTLGYHGPWMCLAGYVAVLTVLAHVRFRGGKWKRMSVIEKKVITAQAGQAE